DIIDSVNAISPRPMAIDRSWDTPANKLNRFCRSDQVNYVNADIPTVYFSLGYSVDYHQPTDEPQYVDYVHGERLGQFVHDVMFAVAERARRPQVVGQDTLYPSCRR
ncbi:MAG: M28 family peptidase, partial [Longimicrobiales bacterium]